MWRRPRFDRCWLVGDGVKGGFVEHEAGTMRIAHRMIPLMRLGVEKGGGRDPPYQTRRVHRLIANRWYWPRTYIVPSDSAGVAITTSAMSLVASASYLGPARMTKMSPSSLGK